MSEHSTSTTHQYAKRGKSRTPLIIGVALAVMVLIGVVALVASNSNESKDASPYTPTTGSSGSQPATVTGTDLPTLGDPSNDPAVGKDAPAITGSDFEGQPITITNDGKPKAILFLAHWCLHCQREVSTLTPWLKAGKAPKGVDLYSVSTAVSADRPNYPPQRWLESEGWPVPVVNDVDGRAAEAYGLSAFPFWTLVDGNGKVVMRFSGEASTGQVEKLLTDLAAT